MEKGFYWVGELNEETPNVLKQRKKLKKKLEFVGWGSKSLIEFLQSIGKDTGKELSQHSVAAIINDYVHNFNLLHPVKKKRVVCDERLLSLFGKKSIPRIKIHELLHSHFADNLDSSEDDQVYSSDEYETDILGKKRKLSMSDEKASSEKKRKSEALLSKFASIVPENIKLLYLKRSLVQELVKQPESFEGKVLGSYVRVKSDPMDFSQKNSHQLHPVTGIKNVPVNGNLPEEIVLEVPNMIKDIPIHTLSDDDFSKEEVEDLCQRVKDGLLKRPTVVEFEQKARILHEDITKHWLPREIIYLQKLINRANEKGWRKEYPFIMFTFLHLIAIIVFQKIILASSGGVRTKYQGYPMRKFLLKAITLFEYLERKKRLQTPSELSKLLAEVPMVIADKLEAEHTQTQEHVQVVEQPIISPVVIHKDVQCPTNDLATDLSLPSGGLNAKEDEVVVRDRSEKRNTEPTNNAGYRERLVSFEWVEDKQTPQVEVKQMPETKSLGQTVDLSNVIELSDDEEETQKQADEEKPNEQEEDANEHLLPKWFYLDPQGQVQGPVSRFDLERWSKAGYFTPDFKVWKDGQTPDSAILLKDMLSGNRSR
ncbi:hypothetical protein QVD17_37817 [Tagetes erecta]|uniref:GYF domain-containing protein n=1 Tax=Tagetes erecta TaxID=13708 RepID=A0AAD8ND07_TARER|nr:hypothetical protein QVD17_37817 [Tagetes erecta]